MFFVEIIKNFIQSRRENRETQRLSIDSLNSYFDAGDRIHAALLAAEEVMGSHELGLDEDSVKLSNDGSAQSIIS